MRKKTIRSVFALMLAAFQIGCAHLWADTQTVERGTAGEVRVMSWNILRPEWAKEGQPSWTERAPNAVRILREHQPDVVGLQEETVDQVVSITSALPDYSYVKPMNRRSKGGGLLIRTDAWHIIGSGKIPIPGKREASWALLESTRNGARWLFYNAHLIHRTADNSAALRMKGAETIVRHIESYAPKGVPVVFTGDFNALHDMPVMRYLAGDTGAPLKFSNAFNLIHGGDDPRGTWRGLGKEHNGERIDHILINEYVIVLAAEILYYNGLSGAYPSDHYPVQATLRTSLKPGVQGEPGNPMETMLDR